MFPRMKYPMFQMKNKMKSKFAIAAVFICIAGFVCNAATVVMLDGQKIVKDIYEINRSYMYYKEDNGRIYRIAINDIEYLTTGTDSYGFCPVSIYLSDNTRRQVDIVRYNSTCLLYKLPNVVNELYVAKYSDIVSMTKIPKSEKDSLENCVDVKIDDMKDIKKSLQIFSKDDTDNFDFVVSEIDSSDFYDKFWLQINKHLSIETNNLLWDLIEVYSQKEKTLTDIYNAKLSSINKTDLSMQETSLELQSRISSFRSQFLWRAYKLVRSAALIN